MSDRKLARWQSVTVGTLLVGYAGYYFCRSNFAIAKPLLLAEFASQGIDMKALGGIASIGTLCYASGKLFNGILCDFVGGRRMFLAGMFASVACTVWFGVSTGLATFTIAWSLNRLVQSAGWAALVKVASRWYPVHRHATVMGIISLSYLFGDALARWTLGSLMKHAGLGWRQLYFVAAGILATIAVASFFLLKASPSDVGCEEPPADPDNVFGQAGEAARPASLLELLAPFVSSFSFWLVCLMSCGLTLIRETFNEWTPLYLTQMAGATDGVAAQNSSWFPFIGGISVLVSGYLADQMAPGRRWYVMIPFLVLLTVALGVLSALGDAGGLTLKLVVLSSVSFLLIGPYSFLAGVMSLELGESGGSSTASGLVDSAGYFGGVLSGYGVATLAQDYGWSTAFRALTIVAGMTALAALFFLWSESRRRAAARKSLAAGTAA